MCSLQQISSRSFRTTNYIGDIVGARPRKRYEEDAGDSGTRSKTATSTEKDVVESPPAAVVPEKKEEESGEHAMKDDNGKKEKVEMEKEVPSTGAAQTESKDVEPAPPKKSVHFSESKAGSPERQPRKGGGGSKREVSSLRRQTSQPFRCHRRPVSAMPTAKSTTNNKFNTHIQCLSGTNDNDTTSSKETWRPSNVRSPPILIKTVAIVVSMCACMCVCVCVRERERERERERRVSMCTNVYVWRRNTSI